MVLVITIAYKGGHEYVYHSSQLDIYNQQISEG